MGFCRTYQLWGPRHDFNLGLYLKIKLIIFPHPAPRGRVSSTLPIGEREE